MFSDVRDGIDIRQLTGADLMELAVADFMVDVHQAHGDRGQETFERASQVGRPAVYSTRLCAR